MDLKINEDGTQIYDVVIIGAGSAGASVSYYLKTMEKEYPLKILLVERYVGDHYNRYHKKCGEAVSAAFFRDIKPIAKSHILNEIKYTEEFWAGGSYDKFKSVGYIIDRPKFLNNIIEQYKSAGGIFRNDNFVTGAIENDMISIRFGSGFTAKTKYLIGCDGPNSRVRKIFNFDNARKATVMQCLVKKPKNKNIDTFELYYHEKYNGGYRYEFPHGENWKIGYPHDTDEINDEEILEVQAKMIAYGGLKKYVKDNVILIGDAAAQVNPITGGGIRAAFVGGKMLARCIIERKIESFNGLWKKSPYNSENYMPARLAFEKMDNKDLIEFGKRIKGNIIIAFLKMRFSNQWKLYKKFNDADKFSW